ncbi:ABC transporter permease [Halosquirtibacter xylanolyticus]|uniref:ABC transporter permease n=1 Tax=Halosquirtibacter xylanolyticus TaxID=3374599 RepID=UPI003747CF47|nr:ABC transporter permease [Prolixibacteraceae bacterium]
MKPIVEIDLLTLGVSLLLLLFPLYIFYRYKISLIKEMGVSVVRMFVQLLLVGFYLQWIFDLNNPLVNIVWITMMLLVGAGTTVQRTGLSFGRFFLPLFVANTLTVIVIFVFLRLFVFDRQTAWDARYMIPIIGMLLGNALNSSIIGIEKYLKARKAYRDFFDFVRIQTGRPNLASRPFIREAIQQTISPLLAGISVTGLISLPGMMTGQILGGSAPTVAIRYQILILVTIFAGTTLILYLSLLAIQYTLNRRLYKE